LVGEDDGLAVVLTHCMAQWQVASRKDGLRAMHQETGGGRGSDGCCWGRPGDAGMSSASSSSTLGGGGLGRQRAADSVCLYRRRRIGLAARSCTMYYGRSTADSTAGPERRQETRAWVGAGARARARAKARASARGRVRAAVGTGRKAEASGQRARVPGSNSLACSPPEQQNNAR
jgi:hypothetical protein